MASSAAVAHDHPVAKIELRCAGCGSLLAENITPPYTIRCRCKTLNEIEDGQEVRLTISSKPD